MYLPLVRVRVRVRVNRNVFAPGNTSVETDAATLGMLQLSRNSSATLSDDPLCTDMAFASVRVRLLTTFSNTVVTTSSVDVSSAVLHRLESESPSIVTADNTTGKITGVSEGTATVGFGTDWTVEITVDPDDVWHLDGLYTRAFSELQVSTNVSDDGGVAIQLQLGQSQLTRPGRAGRFEEITWAEFVSSTGAVMHKDLSHSPFLTYSVDLPEVISVINSTQSSRGFVEAQGDGSGLVFAHWVPQCSSLSIESRMCIGVELEVPESLRIVGGGSDDGLDPVTLVHLQDAAFTVRAVGSSTQQNIRALLVYRTYSVITTVSFVIDNISLATMGSCAGMPCVIPTPGVSGQTTVRATYGSLAATLSVTVVKAIRVEATMLAHPSYATDGSGSLATIATLRRFGSTASYQRARIQAMLVLSSGERHDVSTHNSTAYAVASDPPGSSSDGTDTDQTSLAIFDMHFVRVTDASGSDARSESIMVTVSGRDGDPRSHFVASVAMDVDTQPNNVASLSSVSVIDSDSNVLSTLHDVSGSSYQVRFTATFDDGFEVTSTDMFGGQFGDGFIDVLFDFNSDHEDEMSVDATGGVTIRENVLGTATVTVSSTGAGGAGTSGSSPVLFVNLKADDLQIDVATNRGHVASGQPLANSTTGEIVELELFLTTTTRIGAVDLTLSFNAEILDFEGAAPGADFGGALIGSLDEGSQTGSINLGGATTNYLRGLNRHIATVRFRAKSAGVAVFRGHATEFVDADTATVNLSYPVSFGAAGAVAMGITGARRASRFRRQTEETAPSADPTDCTPRVGPNFPYGDINGDCLVSNTDVLAALQFLVVQPSGSTAIDVFFSDRQQAGLLASSLDKTRYMEALDIDGNAEVRVSDAHTMLNVLYGFSRFIVATSSDCTASSTEVQLEATVQQASSASTFSTDPANANQTAVYFLVTGPATSTQTLQRSTEWATLGGRFSGAFEGTPHLATGVYTASFDTDGLPTPFGFSVVVLVRVSDEWLLGGFLTGVASANRSEPELQASLTTGDGSFSFSSDRPFAPRLSILGCTLAPTSAPTLEVVDLASVSTNGDKDASSDGILIGVVVLVVLMVLVMAALYRRRWLNANNKAVLEFTAKHGGGAGIVTNASFDPVGTVAGSDGGYAGVGGVAAFMRADFGELDAGSDGGYAGVGGVGAFMRADSGEPDAPPIPPKAGDGGDEGLYGPGGFKNENIHNTLWLGDDGPTLPAKQGGDEYDAMNHTTGAADDGQLYDSMDHDSRPPVLRKQKPSSGHKNPDSGAARYTVPIENGPALPRKQGEGDEGIYGPGGFNNENIRNTISLGDDGPALPAKQNGDEYHAMKRLDALIDPRRRINTDGYVDPDRGHGPRITTATVYAASAPAPATDSSELGPAAGTIYSQLDDHAEIADLADVHHTTGAADDGQLYDSMDYDSGPPVLRKQKLSSGYKNPDGSAARYTAPIAPQLNGYASADGTAQGYHSPSRYNARGYEAVVETIPELLYDSASASQIGESEADALYDSASAGQVHNYNPNTASDGTQIGESEAETLYDSASAGQVSNYDPNTAMNDIAGSSPDPVEDAMYDMAGNSTSVEADDGTATYDVAASAGKTIQDATPGLAAGPAILGMAAPLTGRGSGAGGWGRGRGRGGGAGRGRKGAAGRRGGSSRARAGATLVAAANPTQGPGLGRQSGSNVESDAPLAMTSSSPACEQPVPPSSSYEPDYEVILTTKAASADSQPLVLWSEDGFGDVEGMYDTRTLAGAGSIMGSAAAPSALPAPVATEAKGISRGGRKGSAYSGFAELDTESSEQSYKAIDTPLQESAYVRGFRAGANPKVLLSSMQDMPADPRDTVGDFADLATVNVLGIGAADAGASSEEATCGRTSDAGRSCVKSTVPGSGFCVRHGCPVHGCNNSKSYKAQYCAEHADSAL